MKRREFITLLGGAALAWPLAARAQQGEKRATIGLLGSGTAAAQCNWTAAFVQRLDELGWREGRNLAIEYRWAEGRSERFAKIADELVRLKVDKRGTGQTRVTFRRTSSELHIRQLSFSSPHFTANFVERHVHHALPRRLERRFRNRAGSGYRARYDAPDVACHSECLF